MGQMGVRGFVSTLRGLIEFRFPLILESFQFLSVYSPAQDSTQYFSYFHIGLIDKRIISGQHFNKNNLKNTLKFTLNVFLQT